MSGDYSRRRFDKKLDFSAVLIQQGRVELDSDWNELNDIDSRRLRAETVGMIGRAVVPTEEGRNQSAFEIKLARGTLNIGPGRIYVDGLLAENHGIGALAANTVVFDTVLEEDRATQPIRYDKQPYFPNAQSIAPLPTEGSPYAVYLDVWQREVTFLERPEIVENAIGVDTTTRMQTAWQVKWLRDEGTQTCAAPLPSTLIQPSGGRLSTAAVGVPTATDPCLVPPTGGYRGLDNRLYRIEIHDGGSAGNANFKWSRDNASMATNVTAISPDLRTLTVSSVARDSVMRFAVGDWIEVVDDVLEFASQPGLPKVQQGAGVLAHIKSVVSETLAIELVDPLPSGVFPTGNLPPARHTRVRRWDQHGKVFDTKGNLLVDLDAALSLGVIPVPKQGASIVLEDGVQITFDTADTAEYRAADYWNFVARTADASVETLDRAPPRGVHHHFCRLAVVSLVPQTPPVDCRTFWPPSFGAAASCECTVCVSVDQFNSDRSSIQNGINRLLQTGGKLCLGPGIFALEETVEVNSPVVSIHVSGRGQSTVLRKPSTGPAFRITGVGITVEDLQVWTMPSVPTTTGGPSPTTPAFAVTEVFDFAIERCWVTPVPQPPGVPPLIPTDPAILLGGSILNATIRDNILVATHGVAARGAGEQGAVSSNLRILANDIWAWSVGIELTDVFTSADTRLSGNSIFVNPEPSAPIGVFAGMALATVGALTSRLEIDSNHVVVTVPGAAGQVFGQTAGIFAGRPPAAPNPALATAIRIVDNDVFVNWTTGVVEGIGVNNMDAFDHIVLAGNTVRGFSTAPTVTETAWLGLAVVSGGQIGQQRCGISDNMVQAFVGANAAYQGAMVTINGECAFTGNQIVNDNPDGAASSVDVEISGSVIVAGDNRVRGKPSGPAGTPQHVGMQLNPTTKDAAAALGNICSGRIKVGGADAAGPPFNITGI
jgi:hypothetical protein